MADVWRRERVEYAAGLGTIAIATTLAALDAWPFDGPRVARADAPIWEELVYHGAVLGFLRLAVVVLALCGIASVPALIVGGRWAKGLGTTGITADDARWAVDATNGCRPAYGRPQTRQ
jgi:hypothetical protein